MGSLFAAVKCLRVDAPGRIKTTSGGRTAPQHTPSGLNPAHHTGPRNENVPTPAIVEVEVHYRTTASLIFAMFNAFGLPDSGEKRDVTWDLCVRTE